MTVLKVSEARANLYQLIDETAQSHQPVMITGKRHNAVLCRKTIGGQCKKRCTWFPFRACANRSSKACKRQSKNALRNLNGKVALGLHPPGQRDSPSWQRQASNRKRLNYWRSWRRTPTRTRRLTRSWSVI